MSYHPRFDLLEIATNEARHALHAVFVARQLTLPERMTILADQMQRLSERILQEERHPKHPTKSAHEK